jgi:glucokinase
MPSSRCCATASGTDDYFLLNPGRVVLGGGMTNAAALLFDPVRRVAAARALDPALEVVAAALGAEVGILGGAALMFD